MAILRSDEARDMSVDELQERMEDLKLEMAKEKGKIEVGGFPENAGRIKEIRRTIARIKTVIDEKEGQ